MKHKRSWRRSTIFSKLRHPVILAALVATVSVAAGCSAGAGTAADHEAEADPRVTVSVAAVEVRTMARTVDWTGRLEAGRRAAVVAEVPGRVLEVPVEVGDLIAAGQMLVRLDDENLRQQARQAEASLAAAQASLREAQRAQTVARRELDRLEPLFEAGAISRQQWETAQDDLARVNLAVSEQAPAQVRQAQTALDGARSQLDNAVVKAPFAGEVAAVQTSAGNFAAAGHPLITLVDRESMELTAELNDRQVARITPGSAAQIRVPSLDNQVFTGVVASVAPAAGQSGTFPVRVLVDNPDGLLRAGVHAEITLPVETLEAAVAVPSEAILTRDGGPHVFLVENDQAVLRAIEVAWTDGAFAAVRNGLAAGDRVVVVGQSYLREGSAVRVLAQGEGETP
ncbi:MAG: efflux RND transporter periplasmic adaptor subunit [Thermaerobacterales bacterium]